MAKTLSAYTRIVVFNKTDGRCYYCGVELTEYRKKPTTRAIGWKIDRTVFCVDHFLPKSSGGTDAIDNLVPSCHACNTQKKNYDIEEFRRRTLGKNNKFYYETL